MSNTIYDHEMDPTVASWGVAARAQSWNQAMRAAKILLKTPPWDGARLKISHSRYVPDFPWMVRWIGVEEKR